MYLNCHSYYSLRYGVLSVPELVERGKAAGADVLCLTDINAMNGVYEFAQCCYKAGIRPVAGIEFRENDVLRYIGIAKNTEGFKELNEFLSARNISHGAFPLVAPELPNCFFIYPLWAHPEKLKDHEYIGLPPAAINRLMHSPQERYAGRMVVLQTVTFGDSNGFNVHRALRCVDMNIIAARLQKEQHADPGEKFIRLSDLLKCYERYPQVVKNTLQVLTACSFDFDFGTNKNMKAFYGSRSEDLEHLRRLAEESLVYRYGNAHEAARERMESELLIIEKMGFAAYFLTAWDIIRYSKSRGFWHVGRGSGANSIVAYLIGLTEVCPMELNLYFERFLNPSRSSPPDFDLDWSWQDRDEMLTYIFGRFGKEHVAFCGTTGEFKHRSISQELGKVFGLNQSERNAIAGKSVSAQQQQIVRKIAQYADRLKGFPNLRSMHACGVLISHAPIYYYTAVDMYPKGFATAQIDMYTCEDINLEKIDILSQRGLGHIKDAVALVKRNHGVEIDIHHATPFKSDPECNKMLSEGRTLGCFYIESPAMRGLLRRLHCNNYNVLVAASSIIRPGVAQSGMMKEYIERHNGKPFEYPHAAFSEELSDTYGIMVYQEDVMKIAHKFAALNLADSDTLRRAMTGKKKRPEYEKVKKKYFENCEALGYSRELAHTIYLQIESFAGFSFCKAHSASYSVESYQSLYLKAKYPLEFIVGVINNFGGFYRTEVYVHEAKMSGGNVHCPCINRSEAHTDLQGRDIHLGFNLVKGLEQKLHTLIPEERVRNGPYVSIDDFLRRIPVAIEQVRLLVFIGAFRSLGKTKGEALLEAQMILQQKVSPAAVHHPVLFSPPRKQHVLPQLEHNSLEDVFDELEILEFPVSRSPFEMLQTGERGNASVRDFPSLQGKQVTIVGYLIARKPVPTARGHMSFGTWIDAKGDYFDTTHFPEQLMRYPYNAPGCYLLEGKITVEYTYPMLEVQKLTYLPMIPDPRYEESTTRFPVGSRDNLPYQLTRAPYPGNAERKQLFRAQKY